MTSADITATFKKHPIGLGGGLIALICAGLIYYRSGEADLKKADYEAKSAEAAKMTSNVRNAEKLPQQVAEMKKLAQEMEARLIRPAQLAVNLQYFYKLEAETEVKLIDVRQNPLPKSTGKTQYAGIPYNVSVQGSYKRVIAFIQKLESGPHFSRFSNLTFTKAASSAEASSAAIEGDNMSVIINLELLGIPQ